ncbi:MAG: hypothetical protein KBS83_07195, partial [Lachnospiraceae bacterium]|nr:hypothetical protein [Candidatus Equihabitans merdae]
MRLFKDLNYGKKMMLICVLPLIIISICIGSMSYARARQSAVDAWESSMQEGINRVDMAMSDRAREIDGMMDVVSQLYMELDEDNMWYMCQEMMLSLPEIRSVNIVQGGKLRFSTRDDAVLQEELLKELEESKVERASGTVWSDMEESFF